MKFLAVWDYFLWSFVATQMIENAMEGFQEAHLITTEKATNVSVASDRINFTLAFEF